MLRRKAVVIGAGIGGIACAMRLQSLGFDTEILEALDAPGGRAYVRKADGFVFDMGPTVLTVPHFIEELFSLQQDHAMLEEPDFPAHVLDEDNRVREGISGGPNTSKYVEIIPILPFYRIYFDDGTFFDYDGDPVSTREQIKQLAPEDLAGYEAFHEQARAIFQRGFLTLGYTYFGSLGSMLRVVPDLLKLGAVRSLFGMVSKYFKSDKMRQVFSFEPLLVGGNPMKVPAIYAMIHFVEKTWGIHYAKGGTGALVAGLSHEINTPVGIGITASSHLRDTIKEFTTLFSDRSLKRSDLETFISSINDLNGMVEENLQRASNLIKSFKEVAVDQTAEDERNFFLKQYVEQVVSSLSPKFRNRSIDVVLDGIDESIHLKTTAGPISQIITNLIINSLVHGFDMDQSGQIKITATRNAEELLFTYSDNGKGIAQENLEKIFDPFFTTKRSHGGSGLGMHLVYNIVTKKYRGRIKCESQINHGVTFRMSLYNIF